MELCDYLVLQSKIVVLMGLLVFMVGLFLPTLDMEHRLHSFPLFFSGIMAIPAGISGIVLHGEENDEPENAFTRFFKKLLMGHNLVEFWLLFIFTSLMTSVFSIYTFEKNDGNLSDENEAMMYNLLPCATFGLAITSLTTYVTVMETYLSYFRKCEF